jgi:hypothetical protein
LFIFFFYDCYFAIENNFCAILDSSFFSHTLQLKMSAVSSTTKLFFKEGRQFLLCRHHSNTNNPNAVVAAAADHLSGRQHPTSSGGVSFHHQDNNTMKNHRTMSSQVDYYATSSFEAALNQVLQLERDSPSCTSHQQSLETCVRDFFRV